MKALQITEMGDVCNNKTVFRHSFTFLFKKKVKLSSFFGINIPACDIIGANFAMVFVLWLCITYYRPGRERVLQKRDSRDGEEGRDDLPLHLLVKQVNAGIDEEGERGEANHDLAWHSLSFSSEENQPGWTLGFGFFSDSEEMIKTLETCWKLLTFPVTLQSEVPQKLKKSH